MTITLAELARIRSAAIGDMLGDPGALDEMGSAATVFRLCRELELATKRAVAMSEVAAAAWEGEIPSPLPGHTHMTEEGFTERYNCPWCGGSGHIDDCDEADKQVKAQLERLNQEADWLIGEKIVTEAVASWRRAAREAVEEVCPQPKELGEVNEYVDVESE
ncbi:hypothetical protein LJE06_19455 [Bilophila wadsworthia]|uniref:hypothetical protein n=1 Tax=Bilophila wadsworthia TaxID=35833 RepID=UPI001D0BCA56|nr:hypothetical protein [Bilophila wadsworthia]MCB8573275.1 hypothetical protein [Bilophila wadsworthia]MCC2715068.1 hypothetical protein [Bilophila wadsworthia]